MDVANEISEAISRPVGMGDELDEEDLLNKLEELEQEELDARSPNVPNHMPAHKVTVEEDDEEAELRALQASIAM
ncbi:unnamed protein product [Mucor hiemalis]